MTILGAASEGTVIGGGPPLSVAQFVWSTPDGAEISLTSPEAGYWVLKGRGGFELPPVAVDYDETPTRPGGIFRQARVLPRRMVLPLAVFGTSYEDCFAKRRDLAVGLFRSAASPGLLTVARGDGTRRMIRCRYVDGFSGSASSDTRGVYWAIYAVSFLALDPYWEGSDPITGHWVVGGSSSFFPVLPVHLTSNKIIGAGVVVENYGDVPTSPRWKVTGPGGPITFLSHAHTPTQEWSWGATIGSGESLTVDAADGIHPHVYDHTGANRFGDLDDNPQLFTLKDGLNTIDMTVTGAAAATAVDLYAPALYLTE